MLAHIYMYRYIDICIVVEIITCIHVYYDIYVIDKETDTVYIEVAFVYVMPS